MIENCRTSLIWNIMRRCPYIVAGLRRTGFKGGWLWVGPGPHLPTYRRILRIARRVSQFSVSSCLRPPVVLVY